MAVKGYWRVKALASKLDRLLDPPAPEEPNEPEPREPVEPIEPIQPKLETLDTNPDLPPAVVTGRKLRGLWMPKVQQWAYPVVPKAACTTIGQYLYYVDHGHYYHGDMHKLEYGVDRADLIPEVVRGRLANIPIFCFSVVRNPYSRIVSGFLDKVLDLEQGYRPDIRDRLVSNWGLDLMGEVDQVENFKRFMKFVEHQYAEWNILQESDIEGDPRPRYMQVDIHWLHQTWYMRRARRNVGKVDFIGTVETLNQDLRQLTEHLDPPNVPPLDEMPRFGVGPKREAPLEEYFDDETKRITQTIYGPDFNIFGYSQEVNGPSMEMDGFERAQRYADHVARYQAAMKRNLDEDDTDAREDKNAALD